MVALVAPFVATVTAVAAKVLLALKAPAVVIVRAFIPAEDNVNPVPNNVALELIFPSALIAPLAEIIPKVLVLPSSASNPALALTLLALI